MTLINDDDLGALLVQDLDRRISRPPGVELDVVVRRGRRAVLRRRASVVAGTGLIALIGWAVAATLPSPAGTGEQAVTAATNLTRSPAATPVESEAGTARRLAQGLTDLLRQEDIHHQQQPVVFIPREYDNPVGTFQADLPMDRSPDGAGGVGLFVTVVAAAVNQPEGWIGGPRCTAWDRSRPAEWTCTDRTLADGTLLAIRLDLFQGRPAGGSVTARQPDGDLVAVGTTGGYYHRWPTGVDINVLQRMAASPELNP